MNIIVLRIPRAFISLLRRFPGWRQTLLRQGEQIATHLHNFLAVYFTTDISFLDTGHETIALPAQAMVIVPRGRTHGWRVKDSTTRQGSVGHFHAGHSAHRVTA